MAGLAGRAGLPQVRSFRERAACGFCTSGMRHANALLELQPRPDAGSIAMLCAELLPVQRLHARPGGAHAASFARPRTARACEAAASTRARCCGRSARLVASADPTRRRRLAGLPPASFARASTRGSCDRHRHAAAVARRHAGVTGREMVGTASVGGVLKTTRMKSAPQYARRGQAVAGRRWWRWGPVRALAGRLCGVG